MNKWIVNRGEYQGLEVVILKTDKDNCLCFDRKGVHYWFGKSDLSIRLDKLVVTG